MDTYLTIIAEALNAAKEALDAALTGAGLDALVDWYQGEPREPRESDGPYAWWDWDAFGKIETQEVFGVRHQFRADFGVVVGLTGADRAELNIQLARYCPPLVAAFEALPLPYNLWNLGIYPGPHSDRVTAFRLALLPFRVMGQRARGGVL